MPYCTTTQFSEAFGASELADLTGEDSHTFERSEADAAGMIDGYLASRYALPLASVPAIVTGWALDITRYRLWDERAPDEVRRRYDDAIGQLRDLARGLMSLPPSTTGTPPSAAGFDFDGYGNERVFTADTLAGY